MNKYIIFYLVIINIFEFIIMGLDKLLAIKHKYRIPEFTLLFFSAIGGSIGAIAGMYVFHHKTQKPRFYVGIPIIIILQILLIVAVAIM